MSIFKNFKNGLQGARPLIALALSTKLRACFATLAGGKRRCEVFHAVYV
jgi:hypothetical protein